MQIGRARTVAAGVLALGMTVGLTACSGSSGGGRSHEAGAQPAQQLSAAQLLSAATDKAQQTSTAKFTMKIVSEGEGTAVKISASGVVDSKAPALDMKMRMNLPGGGEMAFTERLVGGHLYMKGMPGTSGWLKLDDKAAKGFTNGQSTNPTDTLASLSKLSSDVHEDGTATIRGQQVKRYSGTMDMDKALDAAAAKSPAVKDMIAQSKDVGFTEAPFTLYIDGQGLPARVEVTVTPTDPAKAQGLTSVQTTQDYYDWGTPVNVTAPAGAKSFDGFQ